MAVSFYATNVSPRHPQKILTSRLLKSPCLLRVVIIYMYLFLACLCFSSLPPVMFWKIHLFQLLQFFFFPPPIRKNIYSETTLSLSANKAVLLNIYICMQ